MINSTRADPEEGLGVRNTYMENHKSVGSLMNIGVIGIDPLENHKAKKSAFSAEAPSARQQSTIRFAGGSMMARFVYWTYIR